MKPIREMTQLEIGAFVCSHLSKMGIVVVLSGGATVSLYSRNKYVSKDIDLVDVYSINRRKLALAMNNLGFAEKNRYFQHPDSPYIVEFPPGPLMVGDEVVRQTHEISFETGFLKVITPTDCVKDRLAVYYHWDDRQALSQALLVVEENKIDIGEIEKWSRQEGKYDDFQKIKGMFVR